MLGDDDLRALVELWPEVLNVVRESERVPWRELFDLVQAWLVPEVRFFPPVKFGDSTSEILRNFASTMLEGMAAFLDDIPEYSIVSASLLATSRCILN